jgi:triosephosphate isomerase
LTKIGKPALIINFKVYREVEGCDALELARVCEEVGREFGVRIAVCPPMTELGSVARAVGLPVLSQNVDPRAPGSSTGWVTPSMVRSAGAAGSLINHSEHRIQPRSIEECVDLCKGSELITVICADTVKMSSQVAAFRPDFVAVEPPELIGGDVSVTTANPRIVENTVEAVKSVSHGTSVLCGAGIKTGKDVRTALDLGADGVLLASGVVKSKDPRSALQDLVAYL